MSVPLQSVCSFSLVGSDPTGLFRNWPFFFHLRPGPAKLAKLARVFINGQTGWTSADVADRRGGTTKRRDYMILRPTPLKSK